MNYYYCDPSGNITILVEENVSIEMQPKVSDFLCKIEPTCEQVGFISFANPNVDIELRMAGGEFCGNATMTTAAFCCYKRNIEEFKPTDVLVSSSGTENPVKVIIERISDKEFKGEVSMPQPIGYVEKDLEYNGKIYHIPIVMFEGMYHAIFEEKMEKEDAESAVVKWCSEMNAKGMGLMFLNEKENKLTPLVYVSALGSYYWENSCASGTTATGIYLYRKYGKEIDVSFNEPGGTLRISVDKAGSPILSGRVKIKEYKATSVDMIS